MALPNKSEEFFYLGHRGTRRFILGKTSKAFHPDYSRLHTHEYDGIYYEDGTGIEKIILLKSVQGIAVTIEMYDSMEHMLLVYPSYLVQWIDTEKNGKTKQITLFQ